MTFPPPTAHADDRTIMSECGSRRERNPVAEPRTADGSVGNLPPCRGPETSINVASRRSG
jgi:hypothetical protein